ncbi:metal-dependent hydrolase [Turneriella parva]|uniref:Membrane-bound metal-dependent hydrolase n=1 Tax=Turneriella parva (strain ATCC BAA-1111 / DSM 21527 / NCTC 11395 / H) TaxID=869212 RepID=I4B525_TURPD|nr:metal-dependent hydrolase [Turneriella parva]AFM12382.1 Protein of unknown function DUF457, transmembrane [Turneriella parva DSM 21527]
MDNLTHSMTAAIAAKFVRTPPSAGDTGTKRTIFWLLVASVNFPDLDVVMAVFRDPILTIKTHRWITHSVLAAPLFAVIPAAVFYRFSKVKDFRLLWFTALLGIYIHIFSDLVTPYGTMLLAPLSNHRFTLSSQFIVDLYFTFGLLAFILLGRYDASRQRFWHRLGLFFMVAYLVGTFGLQQYAHARVRRAVSENRIEFEKISALPLPLSIFDWGGLVQTKSGVLRAEFSLFDDRLMFEDLRHAADAFVDRTRRHAQAVWYLGFAHHPLVHSFVQDNNHIVEIHDMQFSAPARMVKMFGIKKPHAPFALRFTYNAAGELVGSSFNE